MLNCEVIGNLGSDVEIKDANGKKFAAFSVAHTEKWKDANGVDHNETTWVDCLMGNTDSKVLDYLKSGVKVFVRGDGKLRVFSSKKDRCMKAGLTLNVREVELVGGSSDAVPRQLIVPDTGMLLDVEKFYWVNLDTRSWKKDDIGELIDTRGGRYLVRKDGFVAPAPVEEEKPDEQTAETK